MADQCIVCLDTLLQAEEPPPQPLNEPPSNSDPTTTTTTTTVAIKSEQVSSNCCSTDVAADHPIKAEPDVKVEEKNGDERESHEDEQVAVIQVCGHQLHNTCLKEWTTKANSCPICRQAFHTVHVYDKVGGTLLSSYRVEDRKQVAEFDPVAWLDSMADVEDEVTSTPCPVCNSADHEDVLLLCDGCDTPYHTYCIGLDSIPQGAWFCMECADLFNDALQVSPPTRVRRRPRRQNYFPRTTGTMRRARQRARSDEWQGAWGQITGHVWDALNIDLDHDEDDALEEFRRIERLRANERREFERWQERLDIARRLGARDVFERNIPAAIFQRGTRLGSASQQAPSATPQVPENVVRETREEIRAWGALERARECDQTSPSNSRKRKSRSITASPVDPPQEPERKLKRPRTRRIGATHTNDVASSSKSSPSLAPTRTDRTTLANGTSGTNRANGANSTNNTNGTNGTSGTSGTNSTNGTNGPAGPSSAAGHARSPTNFEGPSFLSSLLKEVEMSTPSDDEAVRSLFNDPPSAMVDPSSVATSPAASNHNSPRDMSTTPPPRRVLRQSSPTLLSSHIAPLYPPANYSPTRDNSSGGENSDSENSNQRHRKHSHAANGHSANGLPGNGQSPNGHNHNHNHNQNQNQNHNPSHNPNHNHNHNHHRSPPATELRMPRPRVVPIVPSIRSPDSSPTRPSLSLEAKESISSIVRTALKPHWNSSQLTADQYAAINRDVSRKLYEEVTDPSAINADARKFWEQKATREVAQAVSDLQA